MDLSIARASVGDRSDRDSGYNYRSYSPSRIEHRTQSVMRSTLRDRTNSSYSENISTRGLTRPGIPRADTPTPEREIKNETATESSQGWGTWLASFFGHTVTHPHATVHPPEHPNLPPPKGDTVDELGNWYDKNYKPLPKNKPHNNA